MSVKINDIYQLKKDVKELQNAVPEIPEVDLTSYYTKTETDTKFATKEDLGNIDIPNVDLSGYYNKTESDNKFAIIKHSHPSQAINGIGKTIEVSSDSDYKINTYIVKGKTIDNNGSLISLGEAESNKLQFHNAEKKSNVTLIPKETLIQRVARGKGKIVEKDGRENCIYVYTYNSPSASDTWDMVRSSEFPDSTRAYIVKVDLHLSNSSYPYFSMSNTKYRVDGGEWTTNSNPKYSGWHTFEFTNNDYNNIKPMSITLYASGNNWGCGVDYHFDYDTFSMEEASVVLPMTFEIDIKNPLRSTIDGTVYDEFDGGKITRRVKQENNSIIALDKEIIEFVKPRPFNILKDKKTLIGIVNSMADKMEVKYSQTLIGATELNSDDINLLKANQNLLFQSVNSGQGQNDKDPTLEISFINGDSGIIVRKKSGKSITYSINRTNGLIDRIINSTDNITTIINRGGN